VKGRERLSFIEVTPIGAVNVITVYGWEIHVSEAPVFSQQQLVAVQSRHTAVLGPSPSQLKGTCAPLL